MLSKNALVFLTWLDSLSPDWWTEEEIKAKNVTYDETTFFSLVRQGYIDSRYPDPPVPSYDEWGEEIFPDQYRISDHGKAYIELTKQKETERKKDDIRYWITTGIAVAALVKSFLPEICAGLAYISTLPRP